jgi:hypothetical protein
MSSSSKSGKCSNFGNCSLADARTTVQVPTGMDFVCTECGKSLLMTDMGDSSGGVGNKMALIGAAVAAVVLAAGGAWYFLKDRSKPTPPPPPPSVATPAPAPVPAPEPVAAPTPPAPPITGHCSDADAKAGLCRKAQ